MYSLNKDDCYRDVVRGAVASDGAVAGVWLGLSQDQRSFVIEADYGLTPEMRVFVTSLRPGDGSASGNAVLQHHRVVIRDVEQDYGKHKEAALAAGIRAVTATPLVDSHFHAVGVIALYHAAPHHPSYNASQHLDGCCHVGVKLNEIFSRHGAGPLSPAGRRAVEAIARLLPICGRGGFKECKHCTLSHHLETVLQELPAAIS